MREILVSLFSLALVLGILELGVRLCLFDSRCSAPVLKNAGNFADPASDEYWVLSYLFSRQWSEGQDARPSSELPIDFYEDWGASLEADAELGYARKANIETPCHESSNLGTRGAGHYLTSADKIVFFGDSFVESLACSDSTLTAKMEDRSGIDVLNFGVGGYGFDQSYLLFLKVADGLRIDDSVFLIGLILEDLDRMLLEVRTSPKPFFTDQDGRLLLHTDHIDENDPEAYFRGHPPSNVSYLFDFLMTRAGSPRVYAAAELGARSTNRDSLTELILAEVARIRTRDDMNFAFVLFPTLAEYRAGVSAESSFLDRADAYDLPVIDLLDCLPSSQTDEKSDRYYERGHPNSLANDLLSVCILDATSLLFDLPHIATSIPLSR